MHKKINCPILFFSTTIIISASNQAFGHENLTMNLASEALATSLKSPLRNTVTVGSYKNIYGGTVPLAYYNRGNEWKLSSALPLPSDIIESSDKQVSFLNGVACDRKSRHCTAVGTYTTNTEGPKAPGYAPLSYFSNDGGVHWKLSLMLPLPLDVNTPADNQSTALYSVRCNKLNQRHCVAVGYYINDKNASAPLSYTSTNRGKRWKLSTTLPLPADIITTYSKQRSKLFGLACDTKVKSCSTVGSYINNLKSTVPLIYTSINRGQSWTISQNPLPLPEDAASNKQNSELLAIACDHTGTLCSTVGYYTTSSGGISPLSYSSSDSGNTWYLSSELPLPSDVIKRPVAQKTYLNGIFCDNTGVNCNAVGYYTNTTGGVASLSYTSNDGGNNWTVSPSTLPLPTNAASGLLSNSGLFSIICDSQKNLCTSVGYYRKNDNTGIAPLSYTSTDGGITWDVSPEINLPPDTAENNQMARLNSIN